MTLAPPAIILDPSWTKTKNIVRSSTSWVARARPLVDIETGRWGGKKRGGGKIASPSLHLPTHPVHLDYTNPHLHQDPPILPPLACRLFADYPIKKSITASANATIGQNLVRLGMKWPLITTHNKCLSLQMAKGGKFIKLSNWLEIKPGLDKHFGSDLCSKTFWF